MIHFPIVIDARKFPCQNVFSAQMIRTGSLQWSKSSFD